MWIFCCNYALQPVESLYANALCSKRQGFFCHTEALAEVSINLKRVLNSVDFSPFYKRLKMTAVVWIFRYAQNDKSAVISKWRSAFSLSVIASEQGERGNP